MTERENTLRTIRFEKPAHIPAACYISHACWAYYPQEALFDLMEAHKLLFPEFIRPRGQYTPDFFAVARKDAPFTDDFGCLWKTALNGITGTVVGHPLEDWKSFKSYQKPDPSLCMGLGKIDWDKEKERLQWLRENGKAATAGLRHGHTFLQLCDIRGYTNLIYDMADEEPMLAELIGLVEEFNIAIIQRYADMGADILQYPDDLGMQKGPMISPEYFRKFIKPSYKRLMQPAHEKGIPVHMHSDGHLHALMDDLLESGVEIMNLQDLVNGIDWIKTRLKGKVCIELDIDRQSVTRYGTVKEIDALIREEVRELSAPQGGLMLIYGMYPGTPLENAKAVMDAMEKYI